MGITRSSKVKRRATGGRMPIHRKKRKFEMGRQPSMTKLGEQKVVNVRGRGSGYKYRALKLSEGNFMWVSEGVSRKCKILEVLYNASNNELVRTQTLVKNCIVAVDSTPFKFYWYINYTDVKVNRLPEMKEPKLKEKLDQKKNNKRSILTKNFWINLTTSLNYSIKENYMLVSLLDLVKLEKLMDIYLKEKNWNST